MPTLHIQELSYVDRKWHLLKWDCSVAVNSKPPPHTRLQTIAPDSRTRPKARATWTGATLTGILGMVMLLPTVTIPRQPANTTRLNNRETPGSIPPPATSSPLSLKTIPPHNTGRGGTAHPSGCEHAVKGDLKQKNSQRRNLIHTCVPETIATADFAIVKLASESEIERKAVSITYPSTSNRVLQADSFGI